MVQLWLLHIMSLRRTFDQGLMKIFHRVQEIWSGQESVMDGQTNGQAKAIPIIPLPPRGGGLMNLIWRISTCICRPLAVNIIGAGDGYRCQVAGFHT